MLSRQATVHITGVTPLQQNKEYESSVEKIGNETPTQYQDRTWIHRAHINDDDMVTIPAQAIKKALVSACRYSSEQIPGQGKKTWTKKFEAAVIVPGYEIELSQTKADIVMLPLYVPTNGQAGHGKRVWKKFPTLSKWDCTATVLILDNIIPNDVFLSMLDKAGRFIGIGSWRPENGGENGRFTFDEKAVEWAEVQG
ncbi:MAG: hypothetical protein GY832_22215 [Chloroflexi bacterium]|nr:hypothetical protein [Chloroflexota bacterium]